MGINIKPGDNVYVIAACADTVKRADETCYFREFGGCPFRDDGILDFCGEREDVPGLFECVVDGVDDAEGWIAIRGLSFRSVSETAPLSWIGKRIFTDYEKAEKALSELERKRVSAGIKAIAVFCKKTQSEDSPFYDKDYRHLLLKDEGKSCEFCRETNPCEWESEEWKWRQWRRAETY